MRTHKWICLSLLVLLVITGCESGRQKEQALKSIESLRAMQSVTTVGLTPDDYSKRLGDCRIVVDKLLNAEQLPRLTELKKSIKSSVESYQTALDVMREKPYSSGWIFGQPRLDDEDQIKKELEAKGRFQTVPVGPDDTAKIYPTDDILQLVWARAKKQTDQAETILNKT